MCKEETCKCKEICAKMQAEGLREVIKILEGCTTSSETTFVFKQLQSMENILTVYESLPAHCLLSRIKYVKSEVACKSIYLQERKEILLPFIKEVNAFLSSLEA